MHKTNEEEEKQIKGTQSKCGESCSTKRTTTTQKQDSRENKEENHCFHFSEMAFDSII